MIDCISPRSIIFLFPFLGIKNWKCEKCPKKFGEPGQLKKHLQVVHEGQQNFQCQECDYGCGTLTNLKYHVALIHEGVEPGLKKEPPNLDCDACGKKFTHPSNLRTHIKTIHEGEKNHQCNICGDR